MLPVPVGKNVALLRHPLLRGFKAAGAAWQLWQKKRLWVQSGDEQQQRRTPILAAPQASMRSTQRRGHAVAELIDEQIPAVIDGEEQFGRARNIHAAGCKTGLRAFKPSELRRDDARPVRALCSAIHMVSALATRNGVIMGQLKTQANSNEITVIPALLKLPKLKGCLISIDAIGCQTSIVDAIVRQGGDYLLTVEGNLKQLHSAVKVLCS